jgi:hypothetical protein
MFSTDDLASAKKIRHFFVSDSFFSAEKIGGGLARGEEKESLGSIHFLVRKLSAIWSRLVFAGLSRSQNALYVCSLLVQCCQIFIGMKYQNGEKNTK